MASFMCSGSLSKVPNNTKRLLFTQKIALGLPNFLLLPQSVTTLKINGYFMNDDNILLPPTVSNLFINKLKISKDDVGYINVTISPFELPNHNSVIVGKGLKIVKGTSLVHLNIISNDINVDSLCKVTLLYKAMPGGIYNNICSINVEHIAFKKATYPNLKTIRVKLINSSFELAKMPNLASIVGIEITANVSSSYIKDKSDILYLPFGYKSDIDAIRYAGIFDRFMMEHPYHPVFIY